MDCTLGIWRALRWHSHETVCFALCLQVMLIGKFGFAAAAVCFIAMCSIGFGVEHKPWIAVLEYIITTITIIAVAVPEGLPLAVTLALAFSSSQVHSLPRDPPSMSFSDLLSQSLTFSHLLSPWRLRPRNLVGSRRAR